MKILYIFPHPDDESFGPAAAISQQIRHGYEVYLLTLTRGGATKQRDKLGYSVEEMGEVRAKEMQQVAEVLRLEDLTILDLPDGGLKELDPYKIQIVITEHINQLKPELIITYPVHGVSGHADHLVTHAVVKNTFLNMRIKGSTYLQRLAFYTLSESQATAAPGLFRLNWSTPDDIDCTLTLDQRDRRMMRQALDCYETYREVVEKSQVIQHIGHHIHFEIFQDVCNPPISDLCLDLTQHASITDNETKDSDTNIYR